MPALVDAQRLSQHRIGVGEIAERPVQELLGVGQIVNEQFDEPSALPGGDLAAPRTLEEPLGALKMVPLQDVVDGIADGIERRSDKIVVPKSLTLTANAPGFFRSIFERLGFRDSSIQKAAALASPTGWNDVPELGN